MCLSVFTHISHQLGGHTAISFGIAPHIRLAYDGLTIV